MGSRSVRLFITESIKAPYENVQNQNIGVAQFPLLKYDTRVYKVKEPIERFRDFRKTYLEPRILLSR
jgi:hypothetical protein